MSDGAPDDSPRLHLGWIEGSSIPEALRRLQVPDVCFYISCLDSTEEVADSPMLRGLRETAGEAVRRTGSGLTLSGAAMEELLATEVLTGFDEVWVCAAPPRRPRPEHIVLTAEIPVFRRRLEGLDRWMRENHCLVGLGDGDGLNFAAADHTAAAAITDRDSPLWSTLASR